MTAERIEIFRLVYQADRDDAVLAIRTARKLVGHVEVTALDNGTLIFFAVRERK